MDILQEQRAAIEQLKSNLRDAAARVDLASVSYYRMLLDKKKMMLACLEKAAEEVKAK